MHIKRSSFYFYAVKKLINVCIKINNIMPKVSATTATTNSAEPKSHGIVLMRNYMQQECVKTVI
jgi:hypothetical protein